MLLGELSKLHTERRKELVRNTKRTLLHLGCNSQIWVMTMLVNTTRAPPLKVRIGHTYDECVSTTYSDWMGMHVVYLSPYQVEGLTSIGRTITFRQSSRSLLMFASYGGYHDTILILQQPIPKQREYYRGSNKTIFERSLKKTSHRLIVRERRVQPRNHIGQGTAPLAHATTISSTHTFPENNIFVRNR